VRAAVEAAASIDLTRHEGVHPRLVRWTFPSFHCWRTLAIVWNWRIVRVNAFGTN